MVKNPESDYYSPETRIVLIAPPPVNSHQGVENRDLMVTKLYAEAVVEIGKEEGIPVIDAWTVFWDASGHEEKALATFLTDGLHPSGAGYEVIIVVISHGVIF
jgi:isoamyl acetate esterase